MITGVTGLLFAPVGTLEILATSPKFSVTSPKIVCSPVRCLVRSADSVMKNWHEPVPGPALAIASLPGTLKFSDGLNSSLISSVPPVPVPSGSPP